MSKIFKLELNSTVKDKVTGFKGVILGRSEYSTGCLQYGVCPQKCNKDGVIPEWIWFDETRLTVIPVKKLSIKKTVGGPHPCAPSA